MKLRAGWATDAGRIRSSNQDRALVVDRRLFAVADGMGGHRGGETAAQLAVDSLGASGELVGVDALRDAIVEANDVIFRRASADAELSGMGTTVTAITPLTPRSLALANVGDSRTYLLRDGELRQLTDDHSVVAELVREGRLTEEQARDHPRRSMLTRALGVDPRVEVDLFEIVAHSGDRLLLCSDGLTGELTDDAISSILRRLADPDEAARELVRAAVLRGGRDNVTVVVLDIDDVGETLPTPAPGERGAVRRVPSGDGDTAPLPRASTLPPTTERQTARRAAAPTRRPAARGQTGPRAARRGGVPRLVSMRVVLFVGLLAGVGAVVAWAVQSDPARTSPSTTAATVAPTVSADPFDPTGSASTLVVGSSAVTSATGGATTPVVPTVRSGTTTTGAGAVSSTAAAGTPSNTTAAGTPSNTAAAGTPSSTAAAGTPSSTARR